MNYDDLFGLIAMTALLILGIGALVLLVIIVLDATGIIPGLADSHHHHHHPEAAP